MTSASLSPLIVAPSSSRAATSSRHVKQSSSCRVIIGPSDDDFASVIITDTTTVRELKAEALRALINRDGKAAVLPASQRSHDAAEEKEASSGQAEGIERAVADSVEHYMIVKRISPRAYAAYPSGLSFLPQPMTGSLLGSSSPFKTLQSSHRHSQSAFILPAQPQRAYVSALQPAAPPALSGSHKPQSLSEAAATSSWPAPPSRAPPRAPGTALPGGGLSLPSVNSPPSFNTSDALSPPTVTGEAAGLMFPLSMLGGASLMRLEETDVIVGTHDDPSYELMLERLTDDIHIRLCLDDDTAAAHGTVQLPALYQPDGAEQAAAVAAGAGGVGGAVPAAVLSFPLPLASSMTSTLSSPLFERACELSAGLDVCLMSVHGAYLQSPSPGCLRVSCLDNWTTFTLLDSACTDTAGNPCKYLRSESGEFLTGDESGRLYLDDIDRLPDEAKQQAHGDAPMKPGLLRPCHRWTVKKGLCQSLLSHYGTWLTMSDDGDLSLQAVRYEESCLHICFAVIQGSLRKKTEGGLAGFRRWYSKWFVLSGSTLTFFEQQNDIYDRDNNAALAKKSSGKSKAAAAQPQASSVYSTAGILSINVYPAPSCRFDVEFVNGRVLQVKADSETARDRWVRALRNGKVGKQMDAKAKAGKKKKERENTLKARQQQRQRELMGQNASAAENGADTSAVSSVSPSSLSSASLQPLTRPKGLRVATSSGPGSIAEEGVPPKAITVTHDRRHQTGGASAVVAAASASSRGGGQDAGSTPSISVTPDLSLYRERPLSPTDFSPVGGAGSANSLRRAAAAATAGADTSPAVDVSRSNARSPVSTPSNRPAATTPSASHRTHRRSLSLR